MLSCKIGALITIAAIYSLSANVSALITFTNSLDCNQAQLNVRPELDPNAIFICGQCPGILFARVANTLTFE